MFFEILFAVLLGIGVGTLTGLSPGIHINLVSALVVSFSAFLFIVFTPLALGVFIISMAITHTFTDSIPSIYLGAPDEDKALSALPGHRYLLKGKGHEAVLLVIIGALSAVILGSIFFYFFVKAMIFTEPLIKKSIGYILLLIIIYMILKENSWKKRTITLFFFLFSGALGIIVLNIPRLNQPLFHLLSGLFGVSLLLVSFADKTTIPIQDKATEAEISNSDLAKASLAGTFTGFIAAFLPGFGSSQAAILATKILGELSEAGFLVLIGCINTANMLISICSALVLDKARNGAIISILQLLDQIDFKTALLFLAVSLIAAGAAALIAFRISRTFSGIISKVNYQYVVISIAVLIVSLSIYFDSWIGLLILITSTATGVAASKLGVAKNHLMGCLVLSVILFFLL